MPGRKFVPHELAPADPDAVAIRQRVYMPTDMSFTDYERLIIERLAEGQSLWFHRPAEAGGLFDYYPQGGETRAYTIDQDDTYRCDVYVAVVDPELCWQYTDEPLATDLSFEDAVRLVEQHAEDVTV